MVAVQFPKEERRIPSGGIQLPRFPSLRLPLTPCGTLTRRRNPPRGSWPGLSAGGGSSAGAAPRLRSSVLPGAAPAALRAEPSRAEPSRPSGVAAEPAGPAMGCSSSARSRPQEPPQLPASSGANTLTADDHGTAAAQAQLEPAERVSLASEESSPGEQLPGEEASATLRDVEGQTESVSKREEPEGTEPLPAGEEESSELPSVWREESRGPSPPAPGEDAGAPSPEPAEDSGLVEGSDSSLVEVVEKVHITEEEHLAEGETGEQVETELLSETVSEGPETKEEETGEAVDSAAATEIETANNKE
ncbi:glutamate-rich protein 5 [Agelaius tricolor]|uniref:glutamate-rich protein 5 n=1 Tax=Agelaius tricolor TaxID=9191 RepID=UPI0039F22EDD